MAEKSFFPYIVNESRKVRLVANADLKGKTVTVVGTNTSLSLKAA
jgi:hypothetical protein